MKTSRAVVRGLVVAAVTVAVSGVLVVVEAPVVSAASTQVAVVEAVGDPDRCCDNVASESIDGNLSTGTYTTPSGNTTLPSHLLFGFEASTLVNRLRLYKNGEYGPHGLTIQYTNDGGALTSRTWTNVSGLTNGFQGTELLDATSVDSGGTVTGDVHDSSVDGFASLSFDAVTATGLRISFTTSNPNNHYRVFEFEAWHDTASTCDGQTVTVDLGLAQSPTSGDDVILGTSGPDVVDALQGDDTFCGLGGDDTFYGRDGKDSAFGGDGNDSLYGHLHGDTLFGQGDDDYVAGGGGQDELRGHKGNDTLEGKKDNDIMRGGPNVDTCNGDSGTDQAFGCETTTGVP